MSPATLDPTTPAQRAPESRSTRGAGKAAYSRRIECDGPRMSTAYESRGGRGPALTRGDAWDRTHRARH